MTEKSNALRLKRLGIDTHQEAIIYMRHDCHVCRAEGFSAQARIRVANGTISIIATLNLIAGDLLSHGEASLSETAWARLGVTEGDEITVSHPRPLDSLSRVRAKVYGHRLSDEGLEEILHDIADGRYSDIHLASFITACSAQRLDRDEMIALTRAMVDVGDRLDWGTSPVVDKHSVGGLPGNRTTPIVVAIVTACGLSMPKTSSRAITSPSGTADTMETLAPVDLDLDSMRCVVEKEGGCIIWGGAVRLSPTDDILIRVERALELDSEGQLVASVLSKKVAAGSTHLVLDLPVGPTAKIRNDVDGETLSAHLMGVAEAFGLQARVVRSDGSQPVGRGIGPALEAHDVLAVLQGAPGAPLDLKARALTLAGVLLEMGAAAPAGSGADLAAAVLRDGRAWSKFQAICAAQGGMRVPPVATHTQPILAGRAGQVASIDNRRLSKAAKLAGAPDAKAAGLQLHANLGQKVAKGEPLFTLHAETKGELVYALAYVKNHIPIIRIGEG